MTFRTYQFGLLPLLYFSIISLISSAEQHNDSTFIVRRILIQGNKITRNKIILRELKFSEGQRLGYECSEIQESKNNLINTSLFHFAEIDTCGCAGDSCDMTVVLTERWYVWPFPIFEITDRNFNVWWEKRDFSRVNYGIYIVQENFRGRKETLKLLLRFGYDRKFSLTYRVPFINRGMNSGLAFSAGYTSNHETNYMTKENRHVFVKDETEPLRQNLYGSAEYSYRKGFYQTHTLNISYDRYLFSDTLHMLNDIYPSGGIANFTGFFYSYTLNRRDFNTYPLQGYYVYAELAQRGLGLLSGERNHSSLSIKFSYRHYFRINGRNYFSFGAIVKTTPLGTTPYYLQRGLGYGSETVRAYEYYVIDGPHYGLIKTQYRYRLLADKRFRIGFIKTEKFNTIPIGIYLNLFSDAGYAGCFSPQPLNSLQNSLLAGIGAGVDIVTYYDKVLRMEYSMNRDMEHGFFLHFASPF